MSSEYTTEALAVAQGQVAVDLEGNACPHQGAEAVFAQRLAHLRPLGVGGEGVVQDRLFEGGHGQGGEIEQSAAALARIDVEAAIDRDLFEGQEEPAPAGGCHGQDLLRLAIDEHQVCAPGQQDV